MSSDEIGSRGLFTAELQPLQASLAWTAVSHTFSYYAQYSAH